MRTRARPRRFLVLVAIALATVLALAAPEALAAPGAFGAGGPLAAEDTLALPGSPVSVGAIAAHRAGAASAHEPLLAYSKAPGKSTPKTPTGTITSTKPTLTWTAATRASTYEVRVYKGTTLLARKTGLTKRSWAVTTALPRNVSLSWKVRARNNKGYGAWSKSLAFKIAPKPLSIGDAYGGGILAYILKPTDPGYVAGQTHGLIAATVDCATPDTTSRTEWDTGSSQLLGTTGTALGTGIANTVAIMAVYGSGTGYAAGLARAYQGGGLSDWYLPSQDELVKLWELSELGFGGFSLDKYWSSSEDTASLAWDWSFREERAYYDLKGQHLRVRAVRSF